MQSLIRTRGCYDAVGDGVKSGMCSSPLYHQVSTHCGGESVDRTSPAETSTPMGRSILGAARRCICPMGVAVGRNLD